MKSCVEEVKELSPEQNRSQRAKITCRGTTEQKLVSNRNRNHGESRRRPYLREKWAGQLQGRKERNIKFRENRDGRQRQRKRWKWQRNQSGGRGRRNQRRGRRRPGEGVSYHILRYKEKDHGACELCQVGEMVLLVGGPRQE